LEATGDRTREDQRTGSGEAVVASEETARKDGPDNVLNINGWMTYIPETSGTIQLALVRVKQIPKLETELISARALLSLISDVPFITIKKSIAVHFTEAGGSRNCLWLLEGSNRITAASDIS